MGWIRVKVFGERNRRVIFPSLYFSANQLRDEKEQCPVAASLSRFHVPVYISLPSVSCFLGFCFHGGFL
jgi:hypothetical protein